MLALVLFTAMVAPVLLAARGVAVSKSDGSPNRALAAYRHMEDGLLAAAGFKPEEGGEFWRRDGVCFARGAALQNAWRERREHKGRETSEET